MEPANKINQYCCRHGHRTTTINAAEGVTPFLLRCRSLGCDEMARSACYRVPQTLVPSHEWYRPDDCERATLDKETREHVEHGGLLLRKLDPIRRERYGHRTRRA